MKPFAQLLAASDFSGASRDALAIAGDLAARSGAAVTLLHAYDSKPLGAAQAHLSQSARGPDSSRELVARAEGELRHSRQNELGAVERVELLVIEHPSPALAITERAASVEADLIVVGTHGRAGMSRWLMGSVAEQVTRLAPCSVLTVRPRSNGPQQLPGRILVGTDFSPAAEPALKVSAMLAGLLGAEVTLAYCYDRSVPLLAPAGGPALIDARQIERAAQADLSAALAAVAKVELAAVPRVGHRLLESRNAAASLCSYADDHDVDLIVVGAQGRTGHERVLIGGVAEKVARHASCSVLTAR